MTEIFYLTGTTDLDIIVHIILAFNVLGLYMDEKFVTIRIFEERSWNILEERSATKKLQAI
jgi:hypothetical protein